MTEENAENWKQSAMAAAKIIDELLSLFHLYDQDYYTVDTALRYLAENPAGREVPLTVSISRYLEQHWAFSAMYNAPPSFTPSDKEEPHHS